MTRAQPAVLDHPAVAPGDEARIVALFRACGYRTELATWDWINRQNPDGPSLVGFATQGGTVVSHFGVLRRTLVDGERQVPAGLGVRLASHPQHRRLEVIVRVIADVQQRCGDAGLALLLGFPNDHSQLLLQRMLGWEPIADLPALEADNARLRALPAAATTAPEPCRAFVEEHAARLAGFLAGFSYFRRSAAYLAWRYARKPGHDYHVLEHRPAGKLAGFLVLKTYPKGATTYGHVLEWGVPAQDADLATALLAAAARFFEARGATVVSTWMPPAHPLRATLERLGFAPVGFLTHLACRPLRGARPSAPLYLSMGDSDAF